MRRLILSLVCLVGMTTSAAAAGWWHTSTVQHVYPLGDGRFVLIFNQPHPSCSNPDSYFYVAAGQNGVSEGAIRNLYAAALSGAATGSPVSVFFDDSTPSCFVNRLSVKFN